MATKTATAATKTSTKATKAAKPATKGESGVERSKDLPWSDKKVAIIKALKALKATSATTAVSGAKIAEKADVTSRDVRHYCYHAKAGGLVELAEVEGVAGYSFYLTAKGAKLDPVKAQKDEQAAKSAK